MPHSLQQPRLSAGGRTLHGRARERQQITTGLRSAQVQIEQRPQPAARSLVLPLGRPQSNLPRPVGPRVNALRSLFGIGILIALGVAGAGPAAASQWIPNPPSAAVDAPTGDPTGVPIVSTDPMAGPNSREEALHANDVLDLPPATSGTPGSRVMPQAAGPLKAYNRAGLQKEV